jgi:hypothetical protein
VRDTPQFDRIKRIIDGLGPEYELAAVGLPDPAAREIELLAAGGRDIRKVTPSLEQAALRYGLAAVQRALVEGTGDPTPEQLLAPIAEGAGKQLVLRVANQGNDLAFRALAPSTVADKARHGYDTRMLVRKAYLLRALKAVTWALQRTG